MRIIHLDTNPIYEIPYKVAPKSGGFGQKPPLDMQLPVLMGRVDELPENLDALILTSDLQGQIFKDNKLVLMGEIVPDILAVWIQETFPEWSTQRIGVFLCGDLYAILEKRGGLGDVREVWRSFNWFFKWVVGVSGNHDDYNSPQDLEEMKAEKGIYHLEAESCKVDGIRVAGISGVISNKRKPNRVKPPVFTNHLERLMHQYPDFCLLHQGPPRPNNHSKGDIRIEQVLDQFGSGIVCFGHEHWETPLTETDTGLQLLNLEARVVVLHR